MSDGGLRYNKGKRRWGLIPFVALEELVKVLEMGAAKYGDLNWAKGLSWTETFESLQRHLLAWYAGEDKDSESGLSHLGHVMANVMFLTYFSITGKGRDDRPFKQETQPEEVAHIAETIRGYDLTCVQPWAPQHEYWTSDTVEYRGVSYNEAHVRPEIIR